MVDASEELSRVTWLGLVIYIEFMVAATITIFATVGTAIGQPVVTLFLLAFLQFAITVPGCIYNTQRASAFLILYITLQTITALSELTWFITNIIQDGDASYSVGLGCLVVIQFMSIAVALFFRDKVVLKRQKKGELETHLSHAPRKMDPSSSLESGVESNRSSKITKTEEHEIDTNSSKKSQTKKKPILRKKSKSSKGKRRVAKAPATKSDSRESSKSEEIKTRSTQPSVTRPPEVVAVSSIDVGKKRVEQIKKMMSEMEEEDKSAKRQ